MPKILVADDNANIQKMVSLSFEDRGIQVVAVGNGEAAVRRIPDLQPDLVLADIFMPVRNGYEVCEFVKKDERFSHVPVILLVGAFDPLDEKEARRVGADGVLKKPFVPPDPLIAMVISALEKNPKIAAELAKAKETKEAPPPPEAVPESVIPARAELKPLPNFPEPTPEEAALVYGFGTGRRTLDEEQPAAGAEPKAPVAEADKGAEEEEEFDGAATSRDWRRDAMDFDIPAEAANKPAFVQDEDFGSSMFPSERDVPPRHVRAPEPVEETHRLVQDQTPVQAETESSARSSTGGPDSEFFASTDAPVIREAAPESSSTPPVEPEPAPKSTSQPAAPHWMDQLAQGSSDRPPSDWMSVLSEQSAEGAPADSPEPRQTDSSAPLTLPKASETQADMHSDLKPWASQDSMATHQEASEEGFFVDEPGSSSTSESWLSPSAPAGGTAGQAIEMTAAEPLPIAASKTDEEFETESDIEPPVALKDPDLVEPPAVHVTPEPLLVEEEPQEPSQYGSGEQDLEPLHSFVVPASSAPTVEEAPPQEASSSTEIPATPLEPKSAAVDERIPTGPPPNLEALAEIPFLTPPPEFRAQVREQAGTDPRTVDAVVQKVLEKLEPQLHDLLSQGVLKPLVENLLQNDLTKKEK